MVQCNGTDRSGLGLWRHSTNLKSFLPRTHRWPSLCLTYYSLVHAFLYQLFFKLPSMKVHVVTCRRFFQMTSGVGQKDVITLFILSVWFPHGSMHCWTNHWSMSQNNKNITAVSISHSSYFLPLILPLTVHCNLLTCHIKHQLCFSPQLQQLNIHIPIHVLPTLADCNHYVVFQREMPTPGKNLMKTTKTKVVQTNR